MDVEFSDKRLALIETDRAAETKLPNDVIERCREKLGYMRAAVDERSLRNWKSLHYERLQGDKEGKRSVRVNDQWRIVFKIDTQCSPSKITVLAVEDYH